MKNTRVSDRISLSELLTIGTHLILREKVDWHICLDMIFRAYENDQNLEKGTTLSEMRIHLIGLMPDETLQKKRLLNLKA